MANPTKTRFEDWIGTTVFDSTGDKLGDITDVYYDDITGQPEWMTVSTGWFGTSQHFVPIAGTSQLTVDKRPHESGRVRLHKYVVTDDVDVEVPVRKEVARIVREPASRRGTIGVESDEEIVLDEEAVHVDRQVVAKERVGIDADVTDP